MPIESFQYFIILFRVNKVFTFYHFINNLCLLNSGFVRSLMKKAVVNFCSENGLAFTQVINLYIYFSLSPNITRIAFFCALKLVLTWKV